MGIYSKVEMFAFADFYHRWARTGLTMEEMLINWQRYKDKPRSILDPIKPPGGKRAVQVPVKPSQQLLRDVLASASGIMGVKPAAVNGKGRQRELVTVRQMVAYVGMQLGFEPPDFNSILGWERSGIYHKERKASQFGNLEKPYRDKINKLCSEFGVATFID